MPQDAPNIRELLRRWAAWRRDGRIVSLGYGETTLGRAMRGCPGTGCPRCGGRGRIPGEKFILRRQWIVCPVCEGKGKIKLSPSLRKYNPAFICVTGNPETPDPTSEKIDRAVAAMRCDDRLLKWYFVIWEEYVSRRAGTQETKALRLRISRQYYSQLLREAHAWIEWQLGGKNVTKIA